MERRRVLYLLVVLLLPFGALEARLAWLQGVRGAEEREKLTRRYQYTEIVPPARGRILAADGAVLADDEMRFHVLGVLYDLERAAFAPLERLAARTGVPAAAVAAPLEKVRARAAAAAAGRPPREARGVYRLEARVPERILSDLPAALAVEIETHREMYPGLLVEAEPVRRYLQGPFAVHVTGWVGRVTAADLARMDDDPAFRRRLLGDDDPGLYARLRGRSYLSSLLVGRYGVEAALQERLAGRPGIVATERDARTRERKVTDYEPPRPGEDIRLTIDPALQRRAQQAMSGVAGAAVFLDPRTGDVLAFVSAPDFDPNDLRSPVAVETVERIWRRNPAPALNRASAGHYPPGSVFKAVTATAALESGNLRPDETITCNGRFSDKLSYFKCWIFGAHGVGHGDLDLNAAMEQSCNVFFYTLGDRCGIDALAGWSAGYGFGRPTGIELSPESPGVLPVPEWKKRAMNKPWAAADTIGMAIGQGYLLVTPLQVAVMMAAIANGGTRVTPRVVARADDGGSGDAAPAGGKLPFAPATLDALRRSLHEVVHGDHGTAARSGLPALRAAGKTGTAQTGGNRPNHAWFAGYAPEEDPRVAFAVFVENGGHGNEAAAPRAAQILDGWLFADARKGEPR